MKLKRGQYLLDPVDGEIILLLKKAQSCALIEEVEQWEVKIIKVSKRYPRSLGKLLTKIEQILDE